MTTAASGLTSLLKTLFCAYTPKKKIIMISTGTARKNSTTTPQTQRTAAMCDKRPMPKRSPKMPARTIEMAAALSVPDRPGMRYCSHTSAVKKGVHRSAVSWPASAILRSTT